MTHKEVIAALRSTPSRSKRELFDTAADMIERLVDKPVVSNADRIRAMSDEELAVMLANEIPHGECYGCVLDCSVCEGDRFNNGCANAFYKWLKQPVENISPKICGEENISRKI